MAQSRRTINGVIISVYVESQATRSFQSKVRSRSRSRSNGYDRRAQLLAYARELRETGPLQDQEPTTTSTSMPKKRKWAVPLRKLRHSIRRIWRKPKREWRYETIETEGQSKRYKSCHPRNYDFRKALKKLNTFLKDLASRLKCNK